MAMTLDDPRLIESFRAGENDAFEALVRAHRPALYRHALRKLSDHAAAEDAVQETFMRAYKSRTRVNDDWQLRPWLHQICANVCIDEANRRRKESHKTNRWAIVDMPSRGIAPELEKELGLDADHSDMTAAILSLPANYQEALSMRYVEELEYDEIAEILDISEENVRARVSRASKAVRVLLRPVAAIIAFLAVIFGRRAPKAAMAATVDATSAANAAATATNTATAATQVAHTASAFAPLIETAQAVAIQAPAAMPVLSKAAIGITMVVAATAPVTAPVVIDQIRKSPPASVAAPVVADTASSNTPVVVAPTPEAADAPAPAPAADATANTPSSPAVDTPAASIAPRDNSASGSKGDSVTDADTATPAPGADTPTDGDSDVPVVPAPVVRTGGTLAVAALTTATSGPRLDVTGAVTLTVGDAMVTGSLNGRLSLGTADESGRQRIDGTLTLSTDDGRIDIRVTGYATARDDGALTLSGLFRSSGTDTLLTSGSMRGTLGDSLSLLLSA
jgi:RNA polymerase sigma-70 factor (ECF subfamily)